MSERGFEAVYVGRARAAYQSLSLTERREIDLIREAIEADPRPDDRTKFLRLVPPDITLTAYVTDRWRVLYFISEPGHIAIDYVGHASPGPWWDPQP